MTHFFAVLFLLLIHTGRAKPEWKTFDQAQAIAKETGRPIMITFYADWCRYCRQMDREALSDQRVLTVLKKDFVAVRIDIESSEKLTFRGKQFTHRQFAYMLRATSLPTTAFLTADAEPITYLPGMLDASLLTGVLQFISTGAYKSETLETFLGKTGGK
jgi:thioredoxin-related protein